MQELITAGTCPGTTCHPALEPITPYLVKVCEYFEKYINAEISIFSFIPHSVSIYMLLFT